MKNFLIPKTPDRRIEGKPQVRSLGNCHCGAKWDREKEGCENGHKQLRFPFDEGGEEVKGKK